METITKYDIKEVAWTDKTFITQRANVTFDKLQSFFSKAYGDIYAALNNKGLNGRQPFAIYYSVNEAKKETDLAAAVLVDNVKEPVPGFEKLNIPAAKALQLTYYGSYENMAPAYKALEEYMLKNSLTKAWMLEEYMSDPAVEKDPAKWKTNIYYILK